MQEPIKISQDIAIKICDEIRKKSLSKWFNFLGNHCFCCTKFSKGNYKKMLFSKNSENDGCYLVNAKYLKEKYLEHCS